MDIAKFQKLTKHRINFILNYLPKLKNLLIVNLGQNFKYYTNINRQLD